MNVKTILMFKTTTTTHNSQHKDNLLCHQIFLLSCTYRSAGKDLKRLFQTGRPKEIQQHTNGHHHFVFWRMRVHSYTIGPFNTSNKTVHFPNEKNYKRQTHWSQGVPNLFGVKQTGGVNTSYRTIRVL